MMADFPTCQEVRGGIIAGADSEQTIAEARQRNRARIGGHRLAEQHKARAWPRRASLRAHQGRQVERLAGLVLVVRRSAVKDRQLGGSGCRGEVKVDGGTVRALNGAQAGGDASLTGRDDLAVAAAVGSPSSRHGNQVAGRRAWCEGLATALSARS